MKGCLKLTSPIPTQGLDSEVQHGLNGGGAQCCHSPTTALSSNTATCTTQSQSQTHRKCVAFCAQGSETVYTADEWDRTPAEPARKLSYQDLLELKEIQRSLPHADQPPDIVSGRPGKQFLSGVPIVLLPLLGSNGSTNGGSSESAGGAQADEAKKPPSPSYFSNAHGHTNGNGNCNGWGPPSLTGFGRQARPQAQGTPARPSFPFPPRPVPLSAPASTSARVPAPPISPSPIAQPWRANPQSQNKTGASPSLSPSSPHSSYSNRPPSTPTSPTHPYSNRPPQIQTQAQSRMPWTPPPSLSHLIPSAPIKPREKPKFEFVTLLDNGSSGPSSATVTPGGVNGVGNVEATITKVGPEVALQHIPKLPSGLIGLEGISERDHHNEHDLDEHDQDHDIRSVTSSSSCPSLCASSCPSSCSASEVDTDHEAETEGRHSGLDRYGYAIRLRGKDVVGGNKDGADKHLLPTTHSSSLPFPDPNVGLVLDEGKWDKAMKKKPKLKKEKKFILVNDMEIELDDSDSESESVEEDSPVLSGRTASTGTTTTRGTTTTKIEKISTTTSGGNPASPRSIAAPAPLKSTLWGSRPPPSPSASVSLITPPSTPPSEQISRYGSHTNAYNTSPTSSPSAASRGRKKGQPVMGGSASREHSRSMRSDTSGGSPSPSRSCTGRRVESPVKLKRL